MNKNLVNIYPKKKKCNCCNSIYDPKPFKTKLKTK